jgi:hypothetical protein
VIAFNFQRYLFTCSINFAAARRALFAVSGCCACMIRQTPQPLFPNALYLLCLRLFQF